MMSAELTLVSHHLCPYVQRAVIALIEKSVPFDRHDIDLAAKPDWFQAISPLGKVPLLIVDQGNGARAAVFESSAICEYLDETQPGRRLHPETALERARHRGWMEIGSSILADLWGLETARDSTTYDAKHAMLVEKFTRIEDELNGGPFFAGSAFSFVDAAFAPIFRYFDVFDDLTAAPILAPFPKVMAWRCALMARPSVREAVSRDYAERLRTFLVRHDAWMLTLRR